MTQYAAGRLDAAALLLLCVVAYLCLLHVNTVWKLRALHTAAAVATHLHIAATCCSKLHRF